MLAGSPLLLFPEANTSPSHNLQSPHPGGAPGKPCCCQVSAQGFKTLMLFKTSVLP